MRWLRVPGDDVIEFSYFHRNQSDCRRLARGQNRHIGLDFHNFACPFRIRGLDALAIVAWLFASTGPGSRNSRPAAAAPSSTFMPPKNCLTKQ